MNFSKKTFRTVSTFVMGFTAILLLASCGSGSSGQPPQRQQTASQNLIIDTDMGTDDWLAIAYIAQNLNVNLLGITAVGNGLVPCPDGAFNAEYMLGMSARNKDKSVGCGNDWPMDGYASYPISWRQGGISMLGESMPPRSGQIFPEGATLLASLLRNAVEPVDVLAIGSLTNIAMVISAEPQLKTKIRRITSMGGAVNTPGNLRVHGFTDNHPNAFAEWNFYIDPTAAKIVFESGIPITLVPLDATNGIPLTSSFIERLRRTNQQPLESFATRTFDRITGSPGNGEYFHWDPLAAVVAAKPEICDVMLTKRLTVIADAGSGADKDWGISVGQPIGSFPVLAATGLKRSPLRASNAGATVESAAGGLIDVCMHVTPSVFEQEFINTLRSTN